MDLHLEKLELMKKLLDTDDVSIIKSIKKIFKKQNYDTSSVLNKVQEEDILLGIIDFEEGNVISYESIKKEFEF
jgi:hypothetical protein